MKIIRRNDPRWIEDGDCQFYFFNDPSQPKCFVTNAIVRGDANLFESTDEAMEFIDCDCKGRFENCPYTAALWDFSTPRGVEVDFSRSLVVKEENPTIEVVFGWPYPVEDDEACDVLVIPTNTYLRFLDVVPGFTWEFPEPAVLQMMDECNGMKRPAEVGDLVQTGAEGTPYAQIIHGVISGLGGQPVDDVSDLIRAALTRCDQIGALSVAIHPLCRYLGDVEGSVNYPQLLFSELEGLRKHFQSGDRYVSYVRLYMPPTEEAYKAATAIISYINE